MDPLDLFFKKFSYKFDKGYPDMNNNQDVLLLESLLNKLGVNVDLQEEKKLEYDVLTPRAKEIAQNLINLLGIDQSQIKPASATKIVIYTTDREPLFNKIEQSGKYGEATKVRSGNWKKEGITIILKPTGEKAGEYFELKPQQFGITLDKKISLSVLQNELVNGVKNNNVLSDLQKQALIYAVTKANPLSDAEKQELAKNTGFFNEVNKNFGEPHGALIYGDQIGADSVEFPAAGNYRLLDYILYKGDDRIQVSAKAGKSIGNTAKYEDIIALADMADGKVPEKLKEFSDIIKANSVITGAFEAIEKFGSNSLKQRVKDYKIQYPQYPKIGNKPTDRVAHADRIAIEKDFVKELNANPELNFNELFNNYVQVKYVKYNLNPKTLEAEVYVIESGNFKVKHTTKNSPGHDADKLGLSVSKIS
jgi:hypothetical protein